MPVPENAVSSTAIALTVTLPVFVTWNVYVTTSPAPVTVVGLADFTTVSDEVCVAGTVKVDWSVTFGPVGGVPVAVPMLVTLPRSTSAWLVM